MHERGPALIVARCHVRSIVYEHFAQSCIFREGRIPQRRPAAIPRAGIGPRYASGGETDEHKFTLDITQQIHHHMVVDQLGTTFAALSDPTRRGMIERLSRGPATVHGLTEPFALSQQMISKHIAYLVRARIVLKTKRGRESVCTLRPDAIKAVSDWAFN